MKTFPTPIGPHGQEGMRVTFRTRLVSNCPFADEVDHYDLVFTFLPLGLCLEADSFMEYLDQFRLEKRSQEEMLTQMTTDLINLLGYEDGTISLTKAPRYELSTGYS